METPIGYLIPASAGYVVACPNCAEHRTDRGAPLYYVNVYPYRQTCDGCRTVVVSGGRGWPELFDGK